MGHPMPDASVRDAYQDAATLNGQLDMEADVILDLRISRFA
jgi:hypothetical protein